MLHTLEARSIDSSFTPFAILGVATVEKRPVVIDDAIAIRPMAYLTLGYDHRVIDGAVADHFMSHVKKQLENWDPNAV